MSPLRILIGVSIAGFFLAGEFVAFWHFDLPAKWIPILLFTSVGVVGGVIAQMQVQKALHPFWQRACTGIRWRRRFPVAPKSEIREFLDIFVDAFAFRRRRRCCFLPEDRVMDVYSALYPPGSLADNLELESFCRRIKERYGLDLASSWREDMTLGDIYAQTHKSP
jgi:hypothetical protein